MAEWSKALPLTASCLSPLHVRRLPVTWSEAVVFASYAGLIPSLYLQPASHELATIWQKVLIIEILHKCVKIYESAKVISLDLYLTNVFLCCSCLALRPACLLVCSWWMSFKTLTSNSIPLLGSWINSVTKLENHTAQTRDIKINH